ncbi:hypothetical protein RF11_07280 [Thelohanellus kitauei]|uniref:Uncharacterized protein n=1 Tax=Thelohanellus kitauei TaxID=669202 RepID=A0A0C2JJW8_THEKT|nr:hypothetical protein RF11_07280 [Thelohanellus kitauei]
MEDPHVSYVMETISVMKEFNIKRQYQFKHKTATEAAVRASFRVAHILGNQSKAFTEGECTKKCILPVVEEHGLEKKVNSKHLSSTDGCLAGVRPWKGLSYVNNITIAVGVKFVQKCTGAGLYSSVTVVKKMRGNFREDRILSLCRELSAEGYSNLRKLGMRMIRAFSITYVCEQAFPV